MIKRSLLSIILLLISSPLMAQELPLVDWDDLIDNDNLTTKNYNNNQTAYNAIPGNLSDIHDCIYNNHWAYQTIKDLTSKYNIIAGFHDGKFKGNKTLTRYELAQVLAKTINIIEQDHIKISAIEKAAIVSLKNEFNKEIMTLVARIELNNKEISKLETTHEEDNLNLTDQIDALKKRHFFSPELRFRYAMGDPETYTQSRLRLTSTSYITDKTYAKVRLEASTGNMINNSERNGDVTDADLTLAFIETGDLTKRIPKKLGILNLIGGIIHTNRIFARRYRVAVDQRGFSDLIIGVSSYNSQFLSMSYELASGRRMGLGGEYIKKFNKHNGLIKAGVLRTTGGGVNFPGEDVYASGKESTFYCVMGKMDIPIKTQPVELQVSHYYSFNDNQVDQNHWTFGGRLMTKFENVGVFKAAVIAFGGSTTTRIINGYGANGFSYQFAYNPTIKAFGNLFGDPDKITKDIYNYVPGKTEIGVAFGNFHNEDDSHLRVLDVFLSRYFSKNIFGVVKYTYANPNHRLFGLSSRNTVELMTVFKL